MDASADTRTAAIAAAPDSLALGRELEGIRGLIAGQAGPQADALEVGRLASRLYDAFLLQYNVTPGDPGTAANDDLDGDGFSNTNEFTAGTNPYDEALHP